MTLTQSFLAFSLGLAMGFPEAQAADSNAGLFVEPTLTYEMGKTETKYPSPLSDASGSSDGFGIGGRIGFHISDAVFLGVDGRYGMTDFKDSSVNYSAKAVGTNYGPVIGLQMPDWGLRLWGTYIMGAELNPEANNGYDVKLSKGTGHRLGVGFHVAAVSLNLEYQELKFPDATLEQVGPFTLGSFGNVNYTNRSWIASVSFPLAL